MSSTEANHRLQTPDFDELPAREIELSAGTIRFREAGQGPVLLFVHGLLVDGRLWSRTASRLSESFRCIVPDWPLGSHRVPMKDDADLSPPAIAALVAEMAAALRLEDVTLVGNDTGGAICQMVGADHGEFLGRLVLTNCDTFEHFPPFPFNLMGPLVRMPGGMSLMTPPFRIGAVRRATYATLAAERIDPALADGWLEPSLHDPGIRRDAGRFIGAIDKSQTLAAAEKLSSFERPVLMAWGTRDRFFKLSHAERLADVLPDARIEEIDGARTFVPLDRPKELSSAIESFAARPA